MGALKECGPDIKGLLRFGVDLKSASETALEFFGTDSVDYVAIDGTDAVDQQLDLIVFYVGAFAYSGRVTFGPDGVDIGAPRAREGNLSASAAIPLSEEDAAQVFGQVRESGVEVDSERLPTALMHVAEYYLALQAAKDPAVRLLLLDRTLAGDVAHLVWSTRDFIRDKLCVLQGMDTPAGTVTALDLELARMLLHNQDLAIPAPRSQLLKFASIHELFGGESLTSVDLITRIGADPKWVDRLQDDLVKLDEKFGAFEQTFPAFKIKEGASGYWERVLHAALTVAERIFNPRSGHPLRVPKAGGEVWVTADDLDFLVLIFIRALTRRAWADRLLPIGFIKDTNAFEFLNAAVPILVNTGLMPPLERKFPNFNSDKMLFQTNSVVNAAEIPTPWHTPDIDASFRTMAPQPDDSLGRGKARVNGAYENVITPERNYLKTYIQLWSSESTPSVRSHVFTFDRPVYHGYDHWDEVVLFNRDGPADSEIRPVLHYLRGSHLTNMVMAVLYEMGKEVIPEALGHNYPLFLADKKAKSILEETRQAYLGAVAIEMAKSDLDQQVLFSRKFRDYRSQIEGKRRA
jgi:hypothetical protein